MNRGYACASNNGQTCSRQLASTTEPLLTYAAGASTITTSVILQRTVTTTASSSIIGISTITQFIIWAPLFQLNYQATDLPVSSTLSTSPATATAALPSNTTSSGSRGSNSHTMTIAVAVTIPVVGVALIAAVLGWWFGGKERELFASHMQLHTRLRSYHHITHSLKWQVLIIQLRCPHDMEG